MRQRAVGGVLALAGALVLASCAGHAPPDPVHYACPYDLDFDARLYSDMAMLEGARGHVALRRDPSAPKDALRYGDPTVQATFGLGIDQRLARLDYASIPEPVYCQREGAGPDSATVRAAPVEGPKPRRVLGPEPPPASNIHFDRNPPNLGG